MYLIKKAYLFEDDLSNLKYIVKHKKYVYDAGRQIDVSRGQLLMHDLSKFDPREWVPYRNRFHTELSPEKQKFFRDTVAKHHYPRNKHHIKHWDTIKDMPFKYKMEAIADWYGASKAQGKTNLPFKDWFRLARSAGKVGDMDEETLDYVEILIRRNEKEALNLAVNAYIKRY